ncbi:FecR domain-containing protein [Stenotrophomonas sp.]|uniref:FecR domain-containing protein n=1 Tax=Stenotrophomonas sp. TaxID=69392 RepID=UPI0028964D76|nr:FecR domain-containing protein [Stenotrophomonas sp.]
MRPEPALSAAVLDAAAEWLLLMHDAPDDAGTRSACQHWCAQHPDHARAWQRAQQLQTLLQQVPPDLALPVLGRARAPSRRAAVKRIGLWLTLLPLGGLGWQVLGPSTGTPPLRTAVGERRGQPLPDGGRVELDTDTLLALDYTLSERALRLQRGRIRVLSAVDVQHPPRPLRVYTAHGRIQALGTRFDVAVDDTLTRVALLEGRLRIHAGRSTAWELGAGQQAVFDGSGDHRIGALDDTATTWTTGLRVADRLPLGTLLAELGRYRRGVLRCDPEVAALPVSGAFPLDDSERTLTLLEATYPLRVQRTPGGWWTTVVAR